MKLYKLHIEGLRRLKNVDVFFGDATFCIGRNNCGKSTVLLAIEKLLSGDKQFNATDYYSERDIDTRETKIVGTKIVLEGEFRNVPIAANEWPGFRGRIFEYEIPLDSEESGRCIFYRKTYELGKDVVVELKSHTRTLREQFSRCLTPQQFVEAGADMKTLRDMFSDFGKRIPEKEKIYLQAVDDLWEIGDQQEWFVNPGGIPGNVLSRLPRFLKIPAEVSAFEIEDTKKGVLGKTLGDLFEDVRNASPYYKEAQGLLEKLGKELDPTDRTSEFGKMMAELNGVLSNVFPDSEVHASADLSDPNKALVPSFSVEMSSNVRTPVSHQGSGMVRAAVFGVLRFRQKWVSTRLAHADRSLVIGFEEPEIYLHPSAANQMRDIIYELSSAQSQIVATTHSPYLIDLSRKPRQVLNRFRGDERESVCRTFSVTEKFMELQGDDKFYVKMILKIDDHISRSFFTKHVVIVEGDTEDIVLREALRRLPEVQRLKIRADFEVIKARGKASIIGLAKYLKALDVDFTIIHDRDAGIEGAEKFNGPILEAAGDINSVIVLEECIEDVLGYESPKTEKPSTAFAHTLQWADNWEGVPEKLRAVLIRAFNGYIQ
ncbi:AAA family ATPase [Herbaspirillum sp. C7C8]|uniref:AAA family ATPase n=1 Tax=Herbaspirillum sp. C7C8 TaxID=2736665 RepID=UPI001F523FB7|nr:AAA family ATPase [Herbaspirillum sp. C7C8]MCI1006843.1 AAA family ATPase [Herbaspirillum sp. C7C8]